ncbi:thiamine pyrophosphate-binding protein [Clostridium akagii]|uniref:thiamine pyrophosphate-binding protein n=1 Tax=Clostridium akagii TaxID=91623 RepID=UPI00047B32E8|nr:thiamine pyrophosphate-binding protein [Clostridium akagii]
MNKSLISGGELVIQELSKEGIKDIFTLVGNQVSPILVHASQYNLNVISTRHEQGAVYMADGWAQVKRKAGVAIVSGGPGFTNALTGIIKSFYAHTPLLVIIGNVVKSQKDNGVLQDIDQLEIVQKYTKWSKVVYSTDRIPEYIERALTIANTGTRGPVVLEIPIDVLRNSIKYDVKVERKFAVDLLISSSDQNLAQVINIIKASKKPMVIIGDEVYYTRAEKEVFDFIKQVNIPVYTINKARGVIPDDGLCFGSGRVIEGGNQLYSYKEADLVITIGVFSDYQMGQFSSKYFKNVNKIVSFNINSEVNLNSNFRSDVQVSGSLKINLEKLTKIIESNNYEFNYKSWLKELSEHRDNFYRLLKSYSSNEENKLKAVDVFDAIQQHMKQNTIIVIDGSNAMFWASVLLKCQFPGQLIIAPDGMYGPMGTGVGLAIGAKIANPNYDVILYTGDGSFGFDVVDLDTLRRAGLGIKIFIHNDSTWGLCKSTQLILYKDTEATDLGLVRYDKWVNAFGGIGFLVTDIMKFKECMDKNYNNNKTVCFNLIMDEKEYSPGTIVFNEILKGQK